MTREAIWAVIGTLVVVFGIALVGKPRREAGRHDDRTGRCIDNCCRRSDTRCPGQLGHTEGTKPIIRAPRTPFRLWALRDSNLRPPPCKGGALPAELNAPCGVVEGSPRRSGARRPTARSARRGPASAAGDCRAAVGLVRYGRIMVRARFCRRRLVVAAVVVLASPAFAASTISANSSVVTNTVKNSFAVQPSSPPASSVSCPNKQVKAFQSSPARDRRSARRCRWRSWCSTPFR